MAHKYVRIVLSLIAILLAATSAFWLLLNSGWGQGTMLYIIVPMCISAALYAFMSAKNGAGAWSRYWRHMFLATVIFLASSALLMEGIICVLMFMPIYYLIITATYGAMASREKHKSDPNVFRAYAMPALLFMIAAEGTVPALTVARDNTATHIAVTDQSIAELKANMAKEFDLPGHTNWMLSLFPAPDRIAAGSLNAGDTHNLHFTYKRWIWSNFQKGEMDILIAKNDPRHIQTQITKNTSYLSHYMNIEGTDVHFIPMPDGRTAVSLTVKYERLLDPSWYFGPLQQFAANGSAKYLVENIIVREEGVK